MQAYSILSEIRVRDSHLLQDTAGKCEVIAEGAVGKVVAVWLCERYRCCVSEEMGLSASV